MAPAPDDPEQFFTAYLPRLFEGLTGASGITSVGSLVCRVSGRGEWTLRVRDGALEVTRGMEDDVMLQLTISAEDFAPLVGELAGISADAPRIPRGALVRALGASPETARLVRHVPGSVAFLARDDGVVRRLLVTPGRRPADPGAPDCTIECSLEDLRGARARGESFMALFAQGKLRITGNVQIALALSAVFA